MMLLCDVCLCVHSIIGKTAFANTVIGRAFEDTESTVGINQLTCDIKYASVGTSSCWNEFQKPDKEMEAAVASMIANGFTPTDAEDEANNTTSTTSGEVEIDSTADKGERAREVLKGGGDTPIPIDELTLEQTSSDYKGGDSKTIESDSALGKYMNEVGSSDEDMNVSPINLSPLDAKQFDDELVMKCLAEKMQTDSKFIISVFDFGGQSVFNVSNIVFVDNYRSTMMN
jgi:hypothetical protein